MFATPGATDPLTQGDLFDECPLVGIGSGALPEDPAAMTVQRWYARVIILTQACDLAQPRTDLVLVAQVHAAEKLVERGVLKGSAIRDHIRRHLVFGWYFLPESASPVVFSESIVDLRDVHTVPRTVLEQLAARNKRIATLLPPYREHLAQHFAVTYMRVALPEAYPSRP